VNTGVCVTLRMLMLSHRSGENLNAFVAYRENITVQVEYIWVQNLSFNIFRRCSSDKLECFFMSMCSGLDWQHHDYLWKVGIYWGSYNDK